MWVASEFIWPSLFRVFFSCEWLLTSFLASTHYSNLYSSYPNQIFHDARLFIEFSTSLLSCFHPFWEASNIEAYTYFEATQISFFS